MMRLLALLILVGLVGSGYYYWRRNGGGGAPRSLHEAQGQLKDVALTGAVKTAFQLHKSLRRHALEVSTEDAVVTLRGELPGPELVAAAERVAAAVPDVRQVVNHVKLGGTPEADDARDERTLGERLDDEALEVQVRMAFSLNKNLKHAPVEIQSWKKELRLSGTLENAEQRRLAVQTATEVTGVSRVTDRLLVAGQDGHDEERRAAAERAIKGSASLKGAAISVRLDGGKVVLEGRVKTGAERDLAGLLAREAAGQEIRNALEIRR